MQILFVLVFLFISSLLLVFVSRTFSPIPYFPSNKNDIKSIVSALRLRNNQTVYDLGAGDGIVIFAAAREAFVKNLNTHFVAVEINPVLIGVLWIRKLIHPNGNNIEVVRGNIFTIKYPISSIQYPRVTFFTYISPWYLKDVYKNVRKQLTGFDWISYYYATPGLKPSRTIKVIHPVYTYHA